MRRIPLLLTGAAGLALAASAALAAAGDTKLREMTIRLPGGGVERIEYSGNVPPRVHVDTRPFDIAWPEALFAPDLSFAAFDRMEQDFDRETAMFRKRAEQLQSISANGALDEAALRAMPAGTTSYSMISTSNAKGFCTQSVEVTKPASGGKPEVVRHSSGDCGKGTGALFGAPLAGAPESDDATTSIRYRSGGDAGSMYRPL